MDTAGAIVATFIFFCTALLGACSGRSGSEPGAAVGTDTGTVLVTLADAEGDFAVYTVDVASIALERADGTLGELLDGSTVALSLHAHGAYDQGANVLAAGTIGIRLSESP